MIFICTPKLFTPETVGDTVKVKVASTDCPGAMVAPSLSHVTVSGPFAVAGFQFEVAMLKVSVVPVPVFLMYAVRVADPPGFSAPQSILFRGTVQAASANVSMSADVAIEPEVGTDVDALNAAMVVSVKADATTTSSIAVVVVEIFSFIFSFPKEYNRIVNINKHYLVYLFAKQLYDTNATLTSPPASS